MKEYPRAIRKKLNELSVLAWKRELDSELALLAERLDEWRGGRINSFELSEYIHRFHNGPSKNLWKRYNHDQSDISVAAAVVSGILKNDELTKEISDVIGERVSLFRQLSKKKQEPEQ